MGFSRVQNRYISISNNLGIKEFNILIPAQTKFYLDMKQTLWVSTTKEQSVDENTVLDVIFNVDVKTLVPMGEVKSISSENPELLEYVFSTTRIIDPSESSESNEEYSARLSQKMNLKSVSNVQKLDFVLRSLNISQYTFQRNISLAGNIEIVIVPPELSRFDDYVLLINAGVKETLGEDALNRLIIKRPTLRNLELINYDEITETGIDYINSISLGGNISILSIQSYFGSNTAIILDGKAITKDTTLKQYEKVVLYVINN